MKRFSRPRLLAVLPGFIPSTLLDVVKPMLQLAQEGKIDFRVTLEHLGRLSNLDHTDLLIFCRNVEPRNQRWLQAVERRELPYIYDIDDNLFALNDETDVGRYHRAPERINLLTRYMAGAALVRVYSQPMLKTSLAINPNSRLVVAPVDLELITDPPARQPGTPVRIIYSTSRQQDPLAPIFLPVLKQLLDEYPAQIEVNFWGYSPPDFAGLKDVHIWRPDANYNSFLKRFSSAGFDIGLAPLQNDPFYLSKTNNKFREYGACRIAGIYSNVAVYSECVEDGRTGLLVENDPASWYQAIKRLILDEALRRAIQSRAAEYVRSHYSQELFDAEWVLHIQQALSVPAPAQPEANEVGAHPARSASFIQKFAARGRAFWQRMRRRSAREIFRLVGLNLYAIWLIFKINHLKKL
jgi:glycosyltransferase involved in cell wall biosynthesis